MTAPFIWIIFPLVCAATIYLLHSWIKWIDIAGPVTAVLLALIAFHIPIGKAIPLRLWPGSPSLQLMDTFHLPGASLVVDDSLRPLLALIYILTAMWLAGRLLVDASPLMAPLGLVVVSLSCAALAVRPSVYAPLVGYVTALFCLPLLSTNEGGLGAGSRRFWICQTLGMSIILLANFLIPMSTGQNGANNPTQLPFILIMLGFSLIMPIIPFHSWAVMIPEESKPYESFFALSILSLLNLNLLSNYLPQLSLSGLTDLFQQGLLLIVAGMIFLAGIWIAVEKRLERALGFVFIQQTGAALLLLRLSAVSQSVSLASFGAEIIYIPFSLGLMLCSLSLELLQKKGKELRLLDMDLKIPISPLAGSGLLIGVLSLASFPLLGGFPVMYKLMSASASHSLAPAAASIVGFLLLAVMGLRLMIRIEFEPNSTSHPPTVPLQKQVWLFILVCLLFITGVFPEIYNVFQNIIQAE